MSKFRLTQREAGVPLCRPAFLHTIGRVWGAESSRSPLEPTHLRHGVYDSRGDELRLLLVVTWPGVPR